MHTSRVPRFRSILSSGVLIAGAFLASATPTLPAVDLGTQAGAEGTKTESFSPGMPLTEALLRLQRRGLKLVFSSQVVRPEMKVLSEPTSQDLRAILDTLLAPHGLRAEEGQGGTLVVVVGSRPPETSTLRGSVRSRRALTPLAGVSVSVLDRGIETLTGADGRFEIGGLEPGAYTLRARRPGFVIDQRENVTLSPGAVVEVSFILQPAPLTGEEIVVHPSRISMLQEEPAAPLAVNREEIERLPYLGGDVFRALSLLPGITSNDLTAQFHVRGGRRDEVLVLLDGQELYEAYHLKDYDNALSVVAASSLSHLDLTTGVFPASYGDRMGGILDLTTITPTKPRAFRLSVSFVNAQLEGSGTLGERAWWLVSARRGTTDLAGRVIGNEDPVFWDVFSKLDYRLTPSQSLRLNFLHSDDKLDFTREENGEITRFNTEYDSSYLWLTHQAVLSDRLFVDTAVSASRATRDRRGLEDEEEKQLDVRDERDLNVTGLLQSWNFLAGEHSLKAGFELRRFDAEYDYDSFRSFESPLAMLRSEPRDGFFLFRGKREDDYLSAYLSDRFSPITPLTLELGVRFDRHTLTGDSLWSPRVSLAWGLGRSSVVRVGWGYYFQSQRAYELMVEDADTTLYPAERSEHWVAAFEHLFDETSQHPLRALRAEVYRRRVTDPRPRYENLLEPYEPFPEASLNRFRIEPARAVAEGVELLFRGQVGRRLEWWVNYAYGTTEDEIGREKVPRQIEQRNTINAAVNYDLGRHWDMNLAWRYHTGWRYTPVFLIPADAGGGEELVPVLGRLNSERVRDYHRLDLRVSKESSVRFGTVRFFLDVQNLYHRRNVAGFDLQLDEDAGRIIANQERWPGFLASVGVALEF